MIRCIVNAGFSTMSQLYILRPVMLGLFRSLSMQQFVTDLIFNIIHY